MGLEFNVVPLNPVQQSSKSFGADLHIEIIDLAAILLASGPINGKSGGVLLNSFATLGTFLAVGAPWLFFTTIVCFIVIVVRGRTGR